MHISPASNPLPAVATTPVTPDLLAKFSNVLAKPGSGEATRLTHRDDDPVWPVVEKYADYFFGLPTVPVIAWNSNEKKMWVYARAAEFKTANDAIVRDVLDGIAVEWVGPEGKKADDPDGWYNQPDTLTKVAGGLPGVHEIEYGFRTGRWSFYTTNDAHLGRLQGFISEKIGGGQTRFERWLPANNATAEDAVRGAAFVGTSEDVPTYPVVGGPGHSTL